MVRKIGPMPEVRNSDTGVGSGSAAKASMAAAIAGSVGGVAMAFPTRPTQRKLKSASDPRPALNISMEWARKLAGTGASAPKRERMAE